MRLLTRYLRRAMALSACLVATVSCGSGEPPSCTGARDEACLQIVQRVSGNPITYPEGWVSFVGMRSVDGDIDTEMETGRDLGRAERSFALPPGEYVVEGYVRQCPPQSCDDSPPEPDARDRCSDTVLVRSGARTRVGINLTLGEGCSIDASS